MDNERVALLRTLSEDTTPENVARTIFPDDQLEQQEYVRYCRAHGWL